MSETAEATKMSATRLGLERGLSAEVINFALKLAGLQDGEPGAWWATEEGAPHVAEQFRQRGTGGYAHFNPSWGWQTWDPAVIDKLDLSEAGIARIRQVIADRKLAQKAAREVATAAADAPFLATQAAKHAADAAPDGAAQLAQGSSWGSAWPSPPTGSTRPCRSSGDAGSSARTRSRPATAPTATPRPRT